MLTDPGAYNPNHNREINHSAKITFHVSSKAGKSGFGGTHKRLVHVRQCGRHQRSWRNAQPIATPKRLAVRPRRDLINGSSQTIEQLLPCRPAR